MYTMARDFARELRGESHDETQTPPYAPAPRGITL
jgi:hypothetical protein